MTLRPIQGAPIDAPIPDFPTGKPSPVIVPESRFKQPPPPPDLPPARRSGPVEIRGSDSRSLVFRVIPEVPAINRSSMVISITGEPTGGHFDLTTDKAKAFLFALRDGAFPIVITDSQTACQVDFVIAEDGPTFIVSLSGQDRRFNAGWNFDVNAMATDLLADLGP
jgi:hypothetical protein